MSKLSEPRVNLLKHFPGLCFFPLVPERPASGTPGALLILQSQRRLTFRVHMYSLSD
jgi:hypothetical protein